MTDRELYIQNTPEVAKELLRPHVEAPGSRMSFLPDDPEAHPAQAPMNFYIEGQPQSIADTDATAQMVDPRFSEMMEALSSSQSAVEAVQKAVRHLRGGKDIWLVTPHAGDLVDIAFGMKIFRNMLDQEGFTPDMSIFSLSKSLGWGEYDIPDLGKVPMVPVVQTVADRLLLPWPKTKTSEEILAGLPKSEVRRHNSSVVDYTEELLNEGAVVGALAPTGTTRIATDNPDTYEISPINKGTTGMMAHPDTYVLPMPMWREGEEFIVDILDPVDVENADQAHGVMRMMTSALNHRIEGKTFDYGAAPA